MWVLYLFFWKWSACVQESYTQTGLKLIKINFLFERLIWWKTESNHTVWGENWRWVVDLSPKLSLWQNISLFISCLCDMRFNISHTRNVTLFTNCSKWISYRCLTYGKVCQLFVYETKSDTYSITWEFFCAMAWLNIFIVPGHWLCNSSEFSWNHN